MTLEKRIREHLMLREGLRLVVYRDSLGKPTVGVGHLVLPEDNLEVGDRITRKRADAFLKHDMQWAYRAAKNQAQESGVMTDDWILALTSVNFQLGENWIRKFPNTWKAIVTKDYSKAIANISRSLWAKQTPVRTNDFIAAITKLTEETPAVFCKPPKRSFWSFLNK